MTTVAISAQEVNALRKQTGAGMMDCKKALVEADGDFDKAIEILRKKGQKVAAKRGDREASEGFAIALTASDNKSGILVCLNCETDFVAKNEEFSTFATYIANTALENKPATKEDLLALPYNDITIGEHITEMIGKIGEKIDVSTYNVINADYVVAYIHPGNQVASLVGFNSAPGNIAEVGRDVAMQVAAMNPVALDKDSVDQETIDKEIEIGKDMAIQEGKPADLAEKIAMGRLNKFFKENTLLSQDFIKDNKKSISAYLNEVENGLTVTDFKRVGLN